jgi:toxin ParE1/3/4
MAEIIWTATALNDVNRIAEYISADSEFYASQFVQKIFTATDILQKYPEIGKSLPELPGSIYREILLKKYRIIYRFDDKAVFIITVHHSARLLSNNETIQNLLG